MTISLTDGLRGTSSPTTMQAALDAAAAATVPAHDKPAPDFAQLFDLLQMPDNDPGFGPAFERPQAAPDSDAGANISTVIDLDTDLQAAEEQAAATAEALLPGMRAPMMPFLINAIVLPSTPSQGIAVESEIDPIAASGIASGNTSSATLPASGAARAAPPAVGPQSNLPSTSAAMVGALPSPATAPGKQEAARATIPAPALDHAVASAAPSAAARRDGNTEATSITERGNANVANAIPAWQAADNSDNFDNPGNPAGALKLGGAPTQWRQPLRQALGDQLTVQVERNSEHAVLRLSPPMLGRIEISIRHEAGALQVHMSASNSEVLRQLQAIGDVLRQDLSQRQYNEVSVVVATPQRHAEGDGRQRQSHADEGMADDAPGRALGDAEQPHTAYAQLEERE